MKRRLLAIGVVVLISSLAPLSAVMMFCAEGPCCFGEAGDEQRLTRAGSSCCTPVSCYKPPAQKLPNDPVVSAHTTNLPLFLNQNLVVPATPQVVLRSEASSPPQSIGRRLSALSTLLI